MKSKIFKRIIAFLSILSMLIIPATSISAATPTPTTITYTATQKSFQYTPTAYSITPGSYLTLEDTHTGGAWIVPAGKNFSFSCGLTKQVTFKFVVYNSSGQQVLSQTTSSSSFYFNIPSTTNQTSYFVRVFAVSNSPVSVVSYNATYN